MTWRTHGTTRLTRPHYCNVRHHIRHRTGGMYTTLTRRASRSVCSLARLVTPRTPPPPPAPFAPPSQPVTCCSRHTRHAPTALRSARARAVVAPPSASRRAPRAHAERRPGLRPGAISAAAPAQPDRARSWADHGRMGARATAGTIVRAGGGRSCPASWPCSPRAAAWPHPPGWGWDEGSGSGSGSGSGAGSGAGSGRRAEGQAARLRG